MTRAVWTAAIVVALGAGTWWNAVRGRPETVVLDLGAELPNTVRHLPSLEAFDVEDVTIAGVTKWAIVAGRPSRLAWNLTVPPRAWLRVSLGVREEGWARDAEGGVAFRITIDDKSLLEESLNPAVREADRTWRDVLIDLSAYAGENLDLYLKTDSGSSPAWGDPAVVIR